MQFERRKFIQSLALATAGAAGLPVFAQAINQLSPACFHRIYTATCRRNSRSTWNLSLAAHSDIEMRCSMELFLCEQE